MWRSLFLRAIIRNSNHARFFSKTLTPLEDAVVNKLAYGKLTKGIYKLIKPKLEEHKEIEETIMRLSADPLKLQAYMESIRLRMVELEAENAIYKKFIKALNQLEENKMMLKQSENDPEMKALIDEENEELLAEHARLEEDLISYILPAQKFDKSNCTVELRQAVGGRESALFAEWLMESYGSFAERMGWNWITVKVVNDSQGKGIKNSSFKVQGHNAYKYFKYESGVHKYFFAWIFVVEYRGFLRPRSGDASILAPPLLL